MSLNEFHNLRIISPAWQGYSLDFQCPLIWSINQIKCYITYISPKLQFHQFEITFAGRVLSGNKRLHELVDSKKEKDKTVLFLSSRQAEKFETYYSEKMTRFFNALDQEMQEIRPVAAEDSLDGIPILCSNFDKTITQIAKSARPGVADQPLHPLNNAAPRQPDQDRADDGEGGAQFGGIIQRGVVIGVLWISFMQGSYLQILCISFLLALHEIVTRRRKNARQADRIPNQNQNKDIHGSSERQRRMKLLLFRVKEFFYCYFMSLFPNWNVDKDYLEKYKHLIEQVRRETQQIPPTQQQQPVHTQEEPRQAPENPLDPVQQQQTIM